MGLNSTMQGDRGRVTDKIVLKKKSGGAQKMKGGESEIVVLCCSRGAGCSCRVGQRTGDQHRPLFLKSCDIRWL